MGTTENHALYSEFYSRQTVLKELGQKGQEKLSKAKVAVVGIGALGTVSSLYLALAGIGYLRLIDQDTIEVRNIHRQILYSLDDLHYPKAEIAAKRLNQLNPFIHAEGLTENVNANNVERLLQGVDIVVDGLDNMMTRYLISRTCIKLKIPYVFGAAIGVEGNLSVFHPPETGCLECLFPGLSDAQLLTCETRGVIGAAPGIIASMQALEAIKMITGLGTPLKNKLLVCDFSDMYFTSIDIAKNSKCTACQGDLTQFKKGQRLAWLCGSETANINPEEPLNLIIEQVYPVASQAFKVRLKSRLALMFTYKTFEVSLFNGGRMLIKGVPDEKTALEIHQEILQKLGF